jgi:hypothetical protein
MNLPYDVSRSYFEGLFNMPQNLTTCDQQLYFPSEGRRVTDFYRPLRIHRPLPGLNPQTVCVQRHAR